MSVFCCTCVYYIEIGDIAIVSESNLDLDDKFSCIFVRIRTVFLKLLGIQKKQYKSNDSPGGTFELYTNFKNV